MNKHPLATAIAAAVADRDSVQLAAAVTDTVRLRALLPGGPIEEHGRDAVVARIGGWFADMDTVDLVESAGEAMADRFLIHCLLYLAQDDTRWACLEARGETVVDLVKGFAFPLPFTVISELLGVPEPDQDRLGNWFTTLLAPSSAPEPPAEAVAASAAIVRYRTELLALKRAAPGEDLVTGLVRAADQGDASGASLAVRPNVA
jgi:hypothetical protein